MGGLAKQAADGIGGFLDLDVDRFGPKFWIGLGGGSDDAMADMLLHESEAYGVEGLGDGGNLGQDVNAVLVLINHPGDAANLSFNPSEPAQVRLFVSGVAMLRWGICAQRRVCNNFFRYIHIANLYPMGVFCKYPHGVCGQLACRCQGICGEPWRGH